MTYIDLSLKQAFENQLALLSQGKFFNIYKEGARMGKFYLLPTSPKSFSKTSVRCPA